MRQLFREGVMHIIPSVQGYYLITAAVESKAYFTAGDGTVKPVESYSKATYAYPFEDECVFIPSLYYRAYGYEGTSSRKYRTKTDLAEGLENAFYAEHCMYYFTSPGAANAKLWKLDLKTGVNEEVLLGIPKRKKRTIRYSYIGMHSGRMYVVYYYFSEQDRSFDDMFMRVYEHAEGQYKLVSEEHIEKGVRGIKCKFSEDMRKKVFLFDKVVWEEQDTQKLEAFSDIFDGDGDILSEIKEMFCSGVCIKPRGQYLAVLDDEQKRFQKIFDIAHDTGNGVKSYAVSFKKRVVVLLWSEKVCIYDLDSGSMIRDLSDMEFGCGAGTFYDVCFINDRLLIACGNGVWELD